MAARKSVLLRLRPEMVEILQEWAADEFRSLNGQVEYLLDRALRESGRGAPRPGAAGETPRDAPDAEAPDA